jgi:hypothetical protein
MLAEYDPAPPIRVAVAPSNPHAAPEWLWPALVSQMPGDRGMPSARACRNLQSRRQLARPLEDPAPTTPTRHPVTHLFARLPLRTGRPWARLVSCLM